MTFDPRNNDKLPLIGYAIILTLALAAISVAAGMIIPAALFHQKSYHIPIPAFFAFALPIWQTCFSLVYPSAIVGALLLGGALLGRGPRLLVSICRRSLPVFSGVAVIVALYLLTSGGIALKWVGASQSAEIKFYQRTLEQFALLEAAQDRLEGFGKQLREQREIALTVVGSISDFDEHETRERIESLVRAIKVKSDLVMRRRLLATLSLFRTRIPANGYRADEILRCAREAGAPDEKSCPDTLDWIALQLNKDGWEPMPLFKLTK